MVIARIRIPSEIAGIDRLHGFMHNWEILIRAGSSCFAEPPSQDSKAAYNPTSLQRKRTKPLPRPSGGKRRFASEFTRMIWNWPNFRACRDLAGKSAILSSITPSGGRVTQDPPEVAGASQSRTWAPQAAIWSGQNSRPAGKLDDSAISVKVSGDKSRRPRASAAYDKKYPCAEGALSGGLRMNAAGSAQVPLASKSENSVNTLAWVALHAAPVSGSAATEGRARRLRLRPRQARSHPAT